MDVIMPQLGETVAEGVVTKWYKKVGDAVKADEVLFDVETDKVSTEIPAPAAGVVAEILVDEGVTAKVGARLAVIRENAAATAASSGPVSAAAGTDGAAAQRIAPSAQHAAGIAKPPLAAPRGGAQGRLSPVVRKLIAEHGLDAGAIAGSGRDGRITRADILGHVDRASTSSARTDASTSSARTDASTSPARTDASTSSARTDASTGSARTDASTGSARTDASTSSARTDGASSVRPELVEGRTQPAGQPMPLGALRKRVAQNMLKAWTSVPHVLQVVEADFFRVEQARRELGAQWKTREGFTLTYLPFIARAVSFALGRYPRLNAKFAGDQITLEQRINLGIAVDMNFEGLLVPVVKDVPEKSLPQLAREIHDLAVRARAGKLEPDELTEGTYTITNNGAYGTVITAPIVNTPQVAILSTDAVRKKAVVIEAPEGDSLAIRPVGTLAQSFDHRAVDGAYAGAFLRELKLVIETRNWTEDLSS